MERSSVESVRKSVEYVESMPDEDVRRYAGQWLAVVDGEVVAHGKDPGRVHEDGWNAGKGEPYMQYIYTSVSKMPFLHYVP